MPRLFCFGMGYTARALARHLLSQGWEIGGTARGDETLTAMSAWGARAFRFDGTAPNPEIDETLSGYDHVLISVPPDAGGCPAYRCHAGATNGKSWLGYLSSTGVYGDHKGRWVTEDSPTVPTSDLGENRLRAETQWRGQNPGASVFRLASIYGPGRSVLDRIMLGRAPRIDHPSHISRVHVDDIVQILAASIGTPAPGEVYNVADTEPGTYLSFIDKAYELLGAEKPPAIALDHPAIPEMTRKHFRDHKRVDASKVRSALEVRLRYPTGADGLRACLGAMSGTETG